MSGPRFNDLVGYLRAVFAALPDRRQGKNISHPMADFGLSAFAVFFTQAAICASASSTEEVSGKRQSTHVSFIIIASIG